MGATPKVPTKQPTRGQDPGTRCFGLLLLRLAGAGQRMWRQPGPRLRHRELAHMCYAPDACALLGFYEEKHVLQRACAEATGCLRKKPCFTGLQHCNK